MFSIIVAFGMAIWNYMAGQNLIALMWIMCAIQCIVIRKLKWEKDALQTALQSEILEAIKDKVQFEVSKIEDEDERD